MATDGALLPNTGLATIKQEILDPNSTYGSPHAALSPTGHFSPTGYIGPESAGKLTELFQRVEEREAALRQCWAALEQTLIDYKQELRIISEIGIHRENEGDSIFDATERTNDATTKIDDGVNSGNSDVADDVTDKNECNDMASGSDEESVNCLVRKYPDKGGKIRMLMRRIKRHDNRLLKEQYCLLKIQSDDDYDKFQRQMKEKELSLMSKVCQLGLVEAKLVEAEKRNMLSSYQLTKLVGHASKLSRLNENTRSGPVRILPNEQLPASVSNLNIENRTAHTDVLGKLRDSVMNPNPFQPLLAEEVTGPEAALVDEASSSLGSPPDASSPAPGAQFTPILPRRRGRPPGPGRGGRVPMTVSMMVRGLATRRRRRGGRVMGQARPRYISEMIAANQGNAGSSSGPSQRARSTNIPIRTLLHMNALGLDISSTYQDTGDNHLSDSRTTPSGAQTQIPETVTDFSERHSETSNGVKRENELEEAEDTTDPFSGLYIDPSLIKTEPVDQNESEEQNESESVDNMDTSVSAGLRNTRRSSRASKRKFEADDQS